MDPIQVAREIGLEDWGVSTVWVFWRAEFHPSLTVC